MNPENPTPAKKKEARNFITRTIYTITLGMLANISTKSYPKLINALKVIVNTAGFYLELEKFRENILSQKVSVLAILESVRKSLK